MENFFFVQWSAPKMYQTVRSSISCQRVLCDLCQYSIILQKRSLRRTAYFIIYITFKFQIYAQMKENYKILNWYLRDKKMLRWKVPSRAFYIINMRKSKLKYWYSMHFSIAFFCFILNEVENLIVICWKPPYLEWTKTTQIDRSYQLMII